MDGQYIAPCQETCSQLCADIARIFCSGSSGLFRKMDPPGCCVCQFLASLAQIPRARHYLSLTWHLCDHLFVAFLCMNSKGCCSVSQLDSLCTCVFALCVCMCVFMVWEMFQVIKPEIISQWVSNRKGVY